jgi:type VI protein secretion system component Hcp
MYKQTGVRRLRVVGATLLATTGLGVGVAFGATALAGASAPHATATTPGLYLDTSTPSINGPSTGLAGAQDIESFSWGAQNATSAKSTTLGKTTESDLTVQFADSQVSPGFLHDLGVGTHFTTLRIIVSSLHSDFVYNSEEFDLAYARVTSISIGGAAGGGVTQESVSFNYRAIKETYQPVTVDGTLGTPVVSEWNFLKNDATYP